MIVALLMLMAVTAVGTAGFVIIERLSPTDALYMTLATISTLGMKSHALPDFSLTGQIWVMILIVIGIGTAMVALSTVVSLVVEGQMRSILGKRKVNLKIASLHNHIIVCGYGNMGQLVCEHLKQHQVQVVVIDHDDHKTATAEDHGLLYVLGDARNESRLIRAGANKAICPQLIGANRLANSITRPGVVEFIEFATQGIELEADQYHIEPNNKLIGQTLMEANLPKKTGLLVIAIKRQSGKTLFNPSAETAFMADDEIIVTGQSGSLAKLDEISA